MVSASRPMMRALRLLKRELDHLGVTIAAKLLPSVLNKYADALSRRFPRGDLRVRRCVRQSVLDGIQAPSDSFPYRPQGEHPVFLKQQTLTELQATWDRNITRLLSPPIDLIPAVLRKLSKSMSPAVLLILHWPRQSWFSHSMQIATHAYILPLPPEQAWDAERCMNSKWRLALLEINLPKDPARWAGITDLKGMRPLAKERSIDKWSTMPWTRGSVRVVRVPSESHN